eukprot:TRINITY_DN1302_c2_g4_i1.p2 TRINITY_DN1302_c2_g4~~TRINITY_DN1302_c2_g4_i1.p2  ORF type:complete len:616 (+),score=175.71 TRINITY_DN1302_c2_g4_i1:66-1850(+)
MLRRAAAASAGGGGLGGAAAAARSWRRAPHSPSLCPAPAGPEGAWGGAQRRWLAHTARLLEDRQPSRRGRRGDWDDEDDGLGDRRPPARRRSDDADWDDREPRAPPQRARRPRQDDDDDWDDRGGRGSGGRRDRGWGADDAPRRRGGDDYDGRPGSRRDGGYDDDDRRPPPRRSGQDQDPSPPPPRRRRRFDDEDDDLDDGPPRRSAPPPRDRREEEDDGGDRDRRPRAPSQPPSGRRQDEGEEEDRRDRRRQRPDDWDPRPAAPARSSGAPQSEPAPADKAAEPQGPPSSRPPAAAPAQDRATRQEERRKQMGIDNWLGFGGRWSPSEREGKFAKGPTDWEGAEGQHLCEVRWDERPLPPTHNRKPEEPQWEGPRSKRDRGAGGWQGRKEDEERKLSGWKAPGGPWAWRVVDAECDLSRNGFDVTRERQSKPWAAAKAGALLVSGQHEWEIRCTGHTRAMRIGVCRYDLDVFENTAWGEQAPKSWVLTDLGSSWHNEKMVARGMPYRISGDIVTCHCDMDAGTLHFSVNGERQPGEFTGLKGPLHPVVNFREVPATAEMRHVYSSDPPEDGGPFYLGQPLLKGQVKDIPIPSR